MKYSQNPLKNRRRIAISQSMRRLARARTCPECGRGNALRVRRVDRVRVTECRYCGYYRETVF